MLNCKKTNILSTLLFLISPIASLPYLLLGVYKKRKCSLLLVIILIGIFSYFYIPSYTDDKVRYIDLYNSFLIFDVDDFIFYIKNRGLDFIFHAFLFFFAKIGLSYSMCFMVITIITLITIFYPTYEFLNQSYAPKRVYLLTLLLLLFSISIPSLFSGVRFYMSISFIYVSILSFLLKKGNNKSLFYLFLACFTHFGVFPIAIFLLLFFLVKNNNNLSKYLFLFSIMNMFLSSFILPLIVEFFSPLYGTSIMLKVDSYLVEDDFLLQSINEGSKGTSFLLILSRFWLVFAYIYIIKTFEIRSILRNLLYTLFFLSSFLYSFPTVFNRYLLLLKLFFTFVLLYDYIYYNNKRASYFLLFVFFASFIADIYILRNNITVSYFHKNMISFISMFFYEKPNMYYIN